MPKHFTHYSSFAEASSFLSKMPLFTHESIKKVNFHYEKTMETHVRIFPFSQQRGAWVAQNQTCTLREELLISF
jgi:hypothetical protein